MYSCIVSFFQKGFMDAVRVETAVAALRSLRDAIETTAIGEPPSIVLIHSPCNECVLEPFDSLLFYFLYDIYESFAYMFLLSCACPYNVDDDGGGGGNDDNVDNDDNKPT